MTKLSQPAAKHPHSEREQQCTGVQACARPPEEGGNSAHSGDSVTTSNQPPGSHCVTYGALSAALRSARLGSEQLGTAQLSSAQLGTVRTNMQDGECGGSRGTRANPTGDREHRHQLHRADPPVSESPPRLITRGGRHLPRSQAVEAPGRAAVSSKLATPLALLQTLSYCFHYRTASRLTLANTNAALIDTHTVDTHSPAWFQVFKPSVVLFAFVTQLCQLQNLSS